MILPLILVFGTGAAASLAVARTAGRLWAWVASFLDLLIAFNELSFAFRRTAEWIRVDLLLSIPLFALVNIALAVLAFRAERRALAAILAGSIVAIPVGILISR